MQRQNNLPEGENNAELSNTWYTFAEVMAIFKRTKSTINRWRRLIVNRLICSKMGGLVLFNKTDVDNFRKMHRR